MKNLKINTEQAIELIGLLNEVISSSEVRIDGPEQDLINLGKIDRAEKETLEDVHTYLDSINVPRADRILTRISALSDLWSKRELKEEPIIDFSLPGQKLYSKSGNVVINTGVHCDVSFAGVVIENSEVFNDYPVGHYSESWFKDLFQLERPE